MGLRDRIKRLETAHRLRTAADVSQPVLLYDRWLSATDERERDRLGALLPADPEPVDAETLDYLESLLDLPPLDTIGPDGELVPVPPPDAQRGQDEDDGDGLDRRLESVGIVCGSGLLKQLLCVW